MYENFYELSADPFRLSPDPGFSFQHRTYRKAMTYMLHALRRAEGFVMVTGQPGTGKSTLVTDLVNTLSPDEIAVARIVSTQLTSNDLLNLVAYSFKLEPEGWSKAKVLVQVERYLQQQFQQGRRPLLIIDEAQGMDEDALEELRLLTNLLLGNQQLLQVFLVGQEELRNTVSRPSLEQLRQRLIATTFLEPLNVDDTRAYINHRLHCVNWQGDPLISIETYALIQRYSHGIPRRINQICSRLFLHGSIEEKHRLGTADLNIVVEELQQELLLPMDTESLVGTDSSPVACDEETYEEEPRTKPAAPGRVPPATTTRPVVARDAQPSSPRVAATRLHMPAGEPAPASAPDTASATVTGKKTADTHRKKRVIAPLLIAILLAAYLSESDIGQSLPDQQQVALHQVRQQQPVQPTNDNDVTSTHTRSEMPLPEEQATNDAGNSATEGGQRPAAEIDSVETSMSGSQPPGEDTRETPVDTTTNDATIMQNEPDQLTPQPAQEAVSAGVPSQGESNDEAATPVPDEEAAPAQPLSKEQKITVLLASGQQSLQQDRLLTPQNDSAYRYYQQVLELDPGNSYAQDGIEQIEARYKTLITYALDMNDWERAELYIARGFRISPNDEGLQALRERLNTTREQLNTTPVDMAPEPDPEDFFTRFKAFITSPPDENIDNQAPTDKP